MSFESLHSSRKTKEAKSFVQSAPALADVHGPSQEVGAQNPLHTGEDKSCNSVHAPISDAEQLPLQPFQVRESSIAGRGIFATQAHRPGSIITAIKPYVSVMSTPYLAEFCTNCSSPPKESMKLRRCTRCRVVWYCTDKCQTIDWNVHKYECKALRKWEESAPATAKVPSDALRCLGRMFCSFKLHGLDSEWTREIKQMQSHRTSLPPSAYEPYTHLAHSLIRYLGVESPLELEPYGIRSTADLVDFISRFTTNAFTLTSYTLDPIGVAISPVVAAINHSCDPNAVVICDQPHEQEPQINLVAIKPIAPGEEIAISYIDITLPRQVRRKELKETYNFDCKCVLCSTPRYDDPRTAMFCPARCGGLRPVPTEGGGSPSCNKCKAITKNLEGELDALNVGQEALGKATMLQHTDPQKAKQLTSNIIPILNSAGLAPSCHPLLAMARLHQELLIASLPESMTQETLDDTIRTAARYAAGVSAILPVGHPVRGVALAELGKLLAVDEPSPPSNMAGSADRFPPSGSARLKLAHETLVRAREELLIGFGTDNGGGLVGREAREAIVRLEKELGAWTQGINNALEDVKATKTDLPRTC